jgi:hypothetical protein
MNEMKKTTEQLKGENQRISTDRIAAPRASEMR